MQRGHWLRCQHSFPRLNFCPRGNFKCYFISCPTLQSFSTYWQLFNWKHCVIVFFFQYAKIWRDKLHKWFKSFFIVTSEYAHFSWVSKFYDSFHFPKQMLWHFFSSVSLRYQPCLALADALNNHVFLYGGYYFFCTKIWKSFHFVILICSSVLLHVEYMLNSATRSSHFLYRIEKNKIT